MTDTPTHPAKFSDSIIQMVGATLPHFMPPPARVLDPFAGVGKVHQLQSIGYETYGIEIEKPWADHHPDTEVGDATKLPFLDGSMNAIVTSPVYGNRLSDSHTAKDGSERHSYTHDIRRWTGDDSYELDENNSGRLYAWGADYWTLHQKAWNEAARVLDADGVMVLNISDFIRKGTIVKVTEGHRLIFAALGFEVVENLRVMTPRLRRGSNSSARVDHESILFMRRES